MSFLSVLFLVFFVFTSLTFELCAWSVARLSLIVEAAFQMDPMQREFTQLQRVWTWLDDSIILGSKAAKLDLCAIFFVTVKFFVNILYIYIFDNNIYLIPLMV